MFSRGRYKSIPVNASDSDPYYFKIVADYIHLNPARAGLAGGKKGKLLGYRWSSLPSHAKGNGPDWLETSRLLRAFELAGDGSFRFGESSGDVRRQASSNHEGIEEVDKFVEMRHLTLITALAGS